MCVVFYKEERMSDNIESFLEVLVSYLALSPNSQKGFTKDSDGMKETYSFVKIPVYYLDYHDTIVKMFGKEEYQQMLSFFQLSDLEDKKELFHQAMSEITRRNDVRISSDQKAYNLYLKVPLQFAEWRVKTFEECVMKKHIDEKMQKFASSFPIENDLARIFHPEESPKTKKLQFNQRTQ